MNPYFETNNCALFNGENPEALKHLPDNCIDTIITDPPYGLSFMGKKWDYDVPSIEIWQECLRVLKPGGTALIFAGSRTQHRMACNVEDAGFILKDCIMWLYGSGFPKAHDISKQLDKGHKRKIIGPKHPKYNGGVPGGKGFHNCLGRDGGERSEPEMLTVPATKEAKLWNGWKSHGLKPAYEPILVAMKPNDGTYAANALKHGVAGLNIDGGRIGISAEDAIHAKNPHTVGTIGENGIYGAGVATEYKVPQGRFPANIILDEKAGRMLDKQSGNLGNNFRKSKGGGAGVGMFGVSGGGTQGQNDSGGASRFFYCAKASKKERNAGCDGLEEKKNHHPTVKPLALMEYLCTLTRTPTGGVVLDPFMGSGTTGIAAIKTVRDFIGIEREKAYCEISEARINNLGEIK